MLMSKLGTLATLVAPVGGGAVLYMAVLAQQAPGEGVSFSLAALGLVTAIVLALTGAILAMWRYHLADDGRQRELAVATNASIAAAKDVQITALTNHIAQQTAANQEKDREIAEHATQVIALLRGTVENATRVGQAQVEALGALRESIVTGEQARGREHAAILDGLQQIGGFLEFRHVQLAAWDGSERRGAQIKQRGGGG